MYEKLSGMTGTAQTEAAEFEEIYGLQVVEVPTNKPVARTDYNDVVYKTEPAKFNAVIEQIIECHEKGQPVLVGTISIEKSELLSKLLSRRGVKHEVLNAKHHEKEAEIVAQAGKKGAVTIATNMAGRGTDIMLGGNAEHMAKADLRREGFCRGTDRGEHRPRRYHRPGNFKGARALCRAGGRAQNKSLRKKPPRCAPRAACSSSARNATRAAASTTSCAAVPAARATPAPAASSSAWRTTSCACSAASACSTIMDSLGVEEDMPIENKMISGTIENAQKKLEARNFSIRKNVLQFDDVMNSQREIIYGQRGKVLRGEDVSENVHTMIHESIAANAQLFLAGEVADDWDFDGLRSHYRGWLAKDGDFRYTPEALGELKQEDVVKVLTDRADAICADKEKRYGSPLMREFERVVLLRTVDTKWMEHIDAMEELRKGIYLRSYGQRDPVVEYRIEGFNMFDEMVASIREDTSRMLLTMELRTEQPLQREQVAKPTGESGADDGSVKKQPAKKIAKPGRNDPCPCGSGKKFKKCTCEQYKDLRS